MRFIDGILAPGTIKGYFIVRDGMAYYTLGNFIGFLKPRDAEYLEWVAL